MKPRHFWALLVGLVCCPLFGAACLWLCQTLLSAIAACVLVTVAGALGAMASVGLFTSEEDQS